MSSKSGDTRENQLKQYDQRIQERRAELEKKGISSNGVNKDKVYEHLLAKRRAIVKAIVAIGAVKARNEAHKEAAAEETVQVPAAGKEKKLKKEKAEKAAPAKAFH